MRNSERNFDDILAQYEVIAALKPGGQKSVYRINHPNYGPAVLKVGAYDSSRNLERIRREVVTLQQIESEYYPSNYDFQITDDNRFIIIEEYVDSRALSTCIDEYQDPVKALELVRELIIGLNVLWERNIVHRDVKPDNILITTSGKPKIIDLGIARIQDMDSLTTLRGAPLTKGYAAPEQLLNHQSSIDHRTDQFNLGIILIQLLLGGRHPFDPRVVGTGNDIPENIMTTTWYHAFLKGPKLSNIRPIASKLLGLYQYQRYRNFPLLLQAIDQCIERIK